MNQSKIKKKERIQVKKTLQFLKKNKKGRNLQNKFKKMKCKLNKNRKIPPKINHQLRILKKSLNKKRVK